jgi:hypothetical protein
LKSEKGCLFGREEGIGGGMPFGVRARATAPKGMPPPVPSSRPKKQQPFSLFKRR